MIMSMASGGGDTGKITVALTEEVEAFFMEKGIEIVGKIMYDKTIKIESSGFSSSSIYLA